MQIYNTLTQTKEPLQPIRPPELKLYVCGVTVYDYCHIGHARTYVSMDVVLRYLRYQGYQVTYVRNITDIDDKIIKRANEKGIHFSELTQTFIQAMYDDFAALKLTPPDHEPRATEFIQPMIDLIQRIIAQGYAYVAANGDVYFDVRRFNKYGQLSHHDIEQLESGARVDVSEVKRDPLDFVLWKVAKEKEPAWESPWGAGRPGWHLECSAMSMRLLGEHFDIHAGGRDLIFPHHENETAQAEAASGEKFVNLWMHAGFLQIDKEKMSKSLGNFVTIREALSAHDAEVLRYFFIASHYRSPLTYSTEALQHAKGGLTRLYTALRYMPEVPALKGSDFEKRFCEAMDDDFNTPIALSVLFDLAHEVQRLKSQDEQAAAAHAALLKQLGQLFGFLEYDPEAFFKADVKIDAQKIEALITAREEARKNKNWQEADRIRNELKDMSIVIEDGAQGTTWRQA